MLSSHRANLAALFGEVVSTDTAGKRFGKLKKKTTVLTALTLLWLVVVFTGIKVLWDFSLAPGAGAVPPAQWPDSVPIERANGRATLIMLAHPHCPCTRASVRELALLMTSCQGKVSAYVVLYRPAGFAEDWARTDLWDSASEIPGVSIIRDDEGMIARSFNSATSGQTVIYNKEGKLIFNGGITAARGHSGDNDGRSAIVAMLNSGVKDTFEGPVFGCPLFDQHSECGEGNQQCSK